MDVRIKKSKIDAELNLYEENIKDQLRLQPDCQILQAKLKTVKDIRHRILVLSLGGFKIITTEGD